MPDSQSLLSKLEAQRRADRIAALRLRPVLDTIRRVRLAH